jgi:hypothetical protein
MCRLARLAGALSLVALIPGARAHAAEAAQGASPAGDAMVGRALFIGARAFRNGGSPCGACHAIGGESAPFAASLGPELSQTFAGLDADAVGGLLTDLPFPTMVPVYAGRPLMPEERTDLTAFLLQASGKPAPDGARVVAWAAALVGAALAILAAVALRRPRSARAALLERARLAPPRLARRGGVPTAASEPGRVVPTVSPRIEGGGR